MVDMHCHILPGIDDGAPDEKVSRAMLEKSAENGVDTIIATPHFDFRHQSLTGFLEARNAAADKIRGAAEELGIEILLGAEVRAAPELDELHGLNELTLGDTSLILIELPSDRFMSWAPAVISLLQRKGLWPVIAHAERYAPVMKEKGVLKMLVERGAQAQVTASALYESGFADKRRIKKFINEGYFGFIGTDAHDVDKRAPDMKKGVDALKKLVGNDAAARLLSNQRISLAEPLL